MTVTNFEHLPFAKHCTNGCIEKEVKPVTETVDKERGRSFILATSCACITFSLPGVEAGRLLGCLEKGWVGGDNVLNFPSQ